MMKHLKSIIPYVLIGLLAAGGADAALWQWSRTAATNATADPSINWAEGMSPSSVNDSARAMMARTAEWRDDLSGLLATGGTSTAYTVTSNQGLSSIPNDGQAIAFTVHTDNGLAPTLRVDGGTIYPIQSAAGTAIGAGVLISGAPYTVKFKLASTAWVLHSFFGQPFVVPVGGIIDYVGATSPNSNFVFPFGQCISRATYAAFFALVSTTYGVCDGTTTFGVPDLRGSITAGRDDMGGSARGLITNAGSSCVGTTLGAQCGAQNVALLQANLPNVFFATSVTGTPVGSISAVTGSISVTGAISGTGANISVGITDPGHSHLLTHNPPTWDGTGGTNVVNISGGTFPVNNSGVAVSSNTTGITSAVSSSGIAADLLWNVTGQTFTGGTPTFTGSSTLSTGSAASGGSGTAVNKLPPVQIVNKLIRIF